MVLSLERQGGGHPETKQRYRQQMILMEVACDRVPQFVIAEPEARSWSGDQAMLWTCPVCAVSVCRSCPVAVAEWSYPQSQKQGLAIRRPSESEDRSLVSPENVP